MEPRSPQAAALKLWGTAKRLVRASRSAPKVPRAGLSTHGEPSMGLVAERASYEASKQEATRKIYQLMDEGRRTATVLRKILRERLGPKSEELAAFKEGQSASLRRCSVYGGTILVPPSTGRSRRKRSG